MGQDALPVLERRPREDRAFLWVSLELRRITAVCWVLHKDGGMKTRRRGREEEEVG